MNHKRNSCSELPSIYHSSPAQTRSTHDFRSILAHLLSSLPVNLPFHPLNPPLRLLLWSCRLLAHSHLLMLFLLLNPVRQLGLGRGVALAGLIRVRWVWVSRTALIVLSQLWLFQTRGGETDDMIGPDYRTCFGKSSSGVLRLWLWGIWLLGGWTEEEYQEFGANKTCSQRFDWYCF